MTKRQLTKETHMDNSDIDDTTGFLQEMKNIHDEGIELYGSGRSKSNDNTLTDNEATDDALAGDVIGANAYKDMVDFKDNEQKLSRKLSREVVDRDTGHRMPSRIIYAGKKLKLSRSRLWYLQAYGGFTRQQFETFVKHYRNELTIDETEVIDLYLRNFAGDKEAKNMLWQLNLELFKVLKSVYVEELKNQRVEQQTTSVNQLSEQLQNIGKSILEAEKKTKK
ncbi:MAG: hypothetical protein UE295_05005 [Acutalibacteraceae bacterium]|nr:hypothetical protein [Acutalibacteraceae bacterium]